VPNGLPSRTYRHHVNTIMLEILRGVYYATFQCNSRLAIPQSNGHLLPSEILLPFYFVLTVDINITPAGNLWQCLKLIVVHGTVILKPHIW